MIVRFSTVKSNADSILETHEKPVMEILDHHHSGGLKAHASKEDGKHAQLVRLPVRKTMWMILISYSKLPLINQ